MPGGGTGVSSGVVGFNWGSVGLVLEVWTGLMGVR